MEALAAAAADGDPGSALSPGRGGNRTYVNFVKGARDVYNISVDYLGICAHSPPSCLRSSRALPLLTTGAALQGTSGRGATWST